MPYSRGDVVLVVYPIPGGNYYKRRPALVVDSDHLATAHTDNIVVMVSSQVQRMGPSTVLVTKASPEGMTMSLMSDSIIVADKLLVVTDREILEQIGTCPLMASVDMALRYVLGL